MNFSYFFQHEDNIPDYGFPFFHGEPVRVDRDTWYGLTKDDYEKTYTNVGTISLNHQFSDALNLRSAFRYSNVRRDLETSIPQTLRRSRHLRTRRDHHRHHQKPAGTPHHGKHLGQPDRPYLAVQHLGFGHTLTSGMELSWERFDNLRYASAGPATTFNNPNNNQTPNPKTVAVNDLTNAAGFGIYAADQIALHEYFDIIGGVRWDYFSADQQNKAPVQVDLTAWTSCSVTAAAWFFIRRRSRATIFPMPPPLIRRPKA